MHYISTSCLRGEKTTFTADVFKVLEIYAKHGIKNIELGASHQHFDNINDLFRYKEKHGFNFIMHCNFPCPKNIDFILNWASKNKRIAETTVENAKNAVKLCHDLNIKLFSVHPGFTRDFNKFVFKPISEPIKKEEAVKLTIQRLQEVVDFAEKYNIKMALENTINDAGAFYDAEDFLYAFSKIKNKNFGMLLDIGHLKMTHPDLEEQKQFVGKIKDRILELHLHQVINGKDHAKLTDRDILKPFNLGIGNIAMTLEAHLPLHDILDSIEVLKSLDQAN